MTNFIEKEPSMPSLRRFLARKLDYTIAVVLYICFVGATWLSILFIKPKFMADIEAHIAWLLLPILSIFLFIPIILSLITYFFGNSFGKNLFGLKVVTADNTPLTLAKLLKREFLVLSLGTGFCIPGISWVILFINFILFNYKTETFWDKKLNLKMTY